jgi:hypothetical protein
MPAPASLVCARTPPRPSAPTLHLARPPICPCPRPFVRAMPAPVCFVVPSSFALVPSSFAPSSFVLVPPFVRARVRSFVLVPPSFVRCPHLCFVAPSPFALVPSSFVLVPPPFVHTRAHSRLCRPCSFVSGLAVAPTCPWLFFVPVPPSFVIPAHPRRYYLYYMYTVSI